MRINFRLKSIFWVSILGLLVLSCSNSKTIDTTDAASVQQEDLKQKAIVGIKNFKIVLDPNPNSDSGINTWQATLSWTQDTSSGVNLAYTIQRSTISGKYPCDSGDPLCDSSNYDNVKSPTVIKNLKAGTTYYFRVVVTDADKVIPGSVVSEEVTLAIPLDSYTEKPGTISATATPGDGQVTISWPDVPRASFYIIQSGKTSGSYPNVISRLAKSPYIVKNLTNEQMSFYVVIAVNSVGSTISNEMQATPKTPPGAFTFLANPGDAKITLNWNASTNAISYQISRSTSASGPFSEITNITATDASSYSYEDTTVTNGTTYYYQVRAKAQVCIDNGTINCIPAPESDKVLSANATPIASPVKVTVTGTPGDSSATLTWSSPGDGSSYTVQYGTTQGIYDHLISSSAASPFLISNLSNGVTYYFRVISVNAIGSVNADEVIVVPAAPSIIPLPGAFAVSSVAIGSKITLTFSAANATSYAVLRGTSPGNYGAPLSTNATSPYEDTNVSNGTTYYYMVTATNAVGTTYASSEISAVPNIPNVVPTGLVLHLDAASANGAGFPGVGCTLGSWTDLSPTNNPGSLQGYTSCNSSSGWNGTGTTTDPYRLSFNGSQRIAVPYNPVYNFDTSTSYSVNAWIRYSGNAPWYTGILAKEGEDDYFQMVLVDNRVDLQVSGAGGNTWEDVRGTTFLNDGQWHYIAFVFNRTTGKMSLYVDGRLENYMTTAETGAYPTQGVVWVGTERQGNIKFSGDIAEVEMYNRALTQADVSQNCNALRERFNGATCQNSIAPTIPVEPFASASNGSIGIKWNDDSDSPVTYTIMKGTESGVYSLLVDGLTTKKYVDSAVVNGTNYYYIVKKILPGGGEVSSQEVSASPIALSSLVTDNLLLNLDASLAQGGTSFPGVGCSSLSWFDLSPLANASNLTNFSSCDASSGWNGSGIDTDPYRLTFRQGSSNRVIVPFNSAYNFNSATSFSLAAWIKYSGTANWYTGIVSKSGVNDFFQMVLVDDKVAVENISGSPVVDAVRSVTKVNDNQWHYVTMVFKRGTTTKISVYIDGRLENETLSSNLSGYSYTDNLFVGGDRFGNGAMNGGSIADATIYNIALTPVQITQNCNALKARFAGATCE